MESDNPVPQENLEAQARLLRKRQDLGLGPEASSTGLVRASDVNVDSIPETHLAICSKCGVPVGDGLEVFGAFVFPSVCEKCDQGSSEALARNEERERRTAIRNAQEFSLITPLFRTKTWDNFRIDGQNTVAWRAATDATFVNGRGLLILGQPGTGKSHLAAAIGNAMIAEGRWPVTYLDAPGLMLRVKSRIGKDNPDPVTVLNVARRAKFLILDDLGVGKQSEWTQETLYELINHRREFILPTIVTTEFPLTELTRRVSERCVSRLQEICEVVEMLGEDRRLTR